MTEDRRGDVVAVGDVLEAMIYGVADVCTERLRPRLPETSRPIPVRAVPMVVSRVA